jgi:integrase
MFYASGSRLTDLRKIQAKDVYLDEFFFFRTVLKKRSKKIVPVRTCIPATVIRLWHEQLKLCSSGEDYLFGRNFLPGKKVIGTRTINTLWKQLVQEPFGISSGPYILKSMYLTALKKQHGSQTAANHAAHNSTEMVDRIYDLDAESSEHQRIKTAVISFVPQQRLASTEKCQPKPFNF